MKRLETKYNKYGWKLIVKRNKEEVTHIYFRSKDGLHKIHKPFYLRLTKEDYEKLKHLFKLIEEKEK